MHQNLKQSNLRFREPIRSLAFSYKRRVVTSFRAESEIAETKEGLK